MEFDTNGRLPAGIHDITIDEFIVRFVDAFPTSQSRRIILDKLIEFYKEISINGGIAEFWVDGSYVTNKINPNDADIIVFVDYPQYIQIAPQYNYFRTAYNGILDIYFWISQSEITKGLVSTNDFAKIVNQRNYWRGQFGFDREDNPKGIVRIFNESLNDYISRR